MIRLSFTTDEIRTLLGSNLIRERVIQLAELASDGGLDSGTLPVIVISEPWKSLGLRPEMIPDLKEGWRENKIVCIKKIRELTQMGLKEAKDCAEQFIEPLVQMDRDRANPQSLRVPDQEET